MLAAQVDGGLQPVLVIARQFRLGKWIEQYLVEARKAQGCRRQIPSASPAAPEWL